MGRYLDPKSDIVFKKIFYDHPNLLISFLNAVLPLSTDQQIVELDYLANEQIPNIPAFKRTIVDVKCKDRLGRTFIVEMQIEWKDSFMQRLLFGTAQAYVNQLEKGEQYELLNPVYGLGIINDTFESESDDWYHHYSMVKVNNPKQEIIKGLTLVFVELPKCPVSTFNEKKLKVLWLRFLRELGEKTKEVDPALLEVPEIKEAIKYAEQIAYSPAEMDAYESYWKAISTEKTLLAASRREGIAEGIAEGMAKGMTEGIAKGITEGTKAVAKSLKSEGLPISVIAKCTGLSEEEVDKL